MSIIKFWKDNIEGFLNEYFASSNKVPPAPPSPSLEEVQAAEKQRIDALPVSCLVLGLIASIQEEPENWSISFSFGKSVSNIKNGMYISHEYDSYFRYQDTVDALPINTNTDYKFNQREQLLLKKVIDKFEENRNNQFQKEANENVAKMKKYFEDLGCPIESKVVVKKKSKKK